MYLKQLSIQGFKTFADRTELEFSPGLTCIVGPNGSGKSNIADAVLWVLGENNVRSLRGSLAQDVIFAGNDRRRPVGMAEVTVTFDNTARILPLEFSEITVTRRLYRSGESEFFINRVACRLRDIYELFLDTGIGRDAYALIGQGEVDQVLSARAEERRVLFEEAAGVKKYQVRKREAVRKLENTEQNLLRVRDVIGEIGAQLGPLQRQSSAARRWRELTGRLAEVEDAWYGRRLCELDEQSASQAEAISALRRTQAELEAVQAQREGEQQELLSRLRELDARLEGIRTAELDALQREAGAREEAARIEARLQEGRRRLDGYGDELRELGTQVQEQERRLENTVRAEGAARAEVERVRSLLGTSGERARTLQREADAQAQELERLRQEWLASVRRQAEEAARLQSQEARVQGLRGQVSRAAEALAEADAERARWEQEREASRSNAALAADEIGELQTQIAALQVELRAGERTLSESRRSVAQAESELARHSARRRALGELQEQGDGLAEGARRLLEGARAGRIPGSWQRLDQLLVVPEGWEEAVTTALGPYADALLCDTAEAALQALAWLRDQSQGRKGVSALVLPGQPLQTAEVLPNSVAAELGRVRAEADAQAAAHRALAWAQVLLGKVALVEGALDQPPPRSEDAPPDLWVTRDGAWRTAAGAFGVGAPGGQAAAGALVRRRELAALDALLPDLTAAAGQRQAAASEAEAAERRLRAELGELQGRLDRARLEQQAALRDADRRHQEAERARLREERVRADHERLVPELGRAEAEWERLRDQWPAGLPAAGTAPGPSAALVAAQDRGRAAEAARRRADQEVTELRVQLARLEQQLRESEGVSRRIREGVERLNRERTERIHDEAVLRDTLNRDRTLLAPLQQRQAAARSALAAARESRAALQEQRSGLHARVEVLRTELREREAQSREVARELQQQEVQRAGAAGVRDRIAAQWLEADAARAHPAPAAPEAELSVPTLAELQRRWDPEAAAAVLEQGEDPEQEIARLRRQIRSLGPVNPDALEQHAAALERHQFLTSQQQDLETAREQLLGVIRELDETSESTFRRAFDEIAAAFAEMFQKLFQGGQAELRLTNPDDPLQAGIEVYVQLPGKTVQHLALLSGGERALTAIAMLFALLRVRPSPFCVLDEVDAPLDESNVHRFTRMVREFSERTQFLVVTHNRGTMEDADVLYGVTMEERGVSRVLSCTLADPIVEELGSTDRSRAA